jgi:YebC/PmpR family DNA-binding regulatory protein
MSGHSKWSTIKRKKGAVDAKRGKIFTKLIKEITLAARLGGGDPEGNPRLRTAILEAKNENMPKDNIERAIKKGVGAAEGGVNYEELIYEGYGPGGVAVLIEVMTDNKQRTVAEIRHIFSKSGGSLAENGCVAWIFEKKGMIMIDARTIEEDVLMEAALEVGAEDVQHDGDEFAVITSIPDFETVKNALAEKNLSFLAAKITMIPQNEVKLDVGKAEQMLKMMEKLEDNDDVQNVYANFDIDDEIMEKINLG